MGTSVNQASPRTLSWNVVKAGYRSPAVPVSRLASEVWRAALNQTTDNIAQLLAQPIVARLGALATEARSATDLARKTSQMLAQSKNSSLASDIARRAAIQCVGSRDRANAFSERVFAEATSYLVSRDLPGFVGSDRTRTVAESLKFRAELAGHVAGLAREIGGPRRLDPDTWARHVQTVIDGLRRSGK